MTRNLEYDDIQLLVRFAHGHLRAARFFFLRAEGKRAECKGWLSELAGEIAAAPEDTTRPEQAIQLAVAAGGLRALGLSEEVMGTFLQEFRDGMGDPERARALGDVYDSAPDHWDFGGREPAKQIHLALMLYAQDRAALERLAGLHRQRFASAGLVVVWEQDTWLDAEGREPFGFIDGISQPRVEGLAPPAAQEAVGDPLLKAGEFILGYENAYDVLPFSPHLPERLDPSGLLQPVDGLPGFKDLGRNGTYLVIRKLEQDVAAFKDFLCAKAVDPTTGQPDPTRADWLAAKLMGRWPKSGAPVTGAPDQDDSALGQDSHKTNAFDYSADQDGFGCPIGAHIRRANPRRPLAALHRIIRRGRAYTEQRATGPGGNQEPAQGFMFLAMNANIARQFEFIQQTWLNNPGFGGLQESRDPIAGANYQPCGKEPASAFSAVVPAKPFRIHLTDVPRLARTRGGDYFFLPGRNALRFLATSAYETPEGESASARASVTYQGMSIAEN